MFFDERRGGGEEITNEPRRRLAAAARVALLIVDLAVDELRSERITDLLAGAAQEDDLTRTPSSAIVDLQQAIAGVRFELELEDPSDPRAAASLAVAEVLDPAGEVVALKAVVARAALGGGRKLGVLTRARLPAPASRSAQRKQLSRL